MSLLGLGLVLGLAIGLGFGLALGLGLGLGLSLELGSLCVIKYPNSKIEGYQTSKITDDVINWVTRSIFNTN